MTARVLSYPPVHGYVDRLHPTSAELVHRDQPWPELPDLYDPDWLRRHRGDWDVVHLHFTWEQYAPDRVAEVLDTHRRAGTPLVWTAHDLRNPHTDHPERDVAYLELLAEHADHVVTLTDGAADEIARRFDRDAQVVAHGSMFSGPAAIRWREERSRLLEERTGDTIRLLLHLRSVRANVDWRTPVRVLPDLRGQGVPVALDVLVERDAPLADQVRAAAGPAVTVHAHDPMSFEQLTRRLIAADTLLLPYRWGTHSGMLEVAADLAVPVIAGAVGYLDQQAPVWTVPVVAGRLDGPSLAARIRRLAHGERPEVVPVGARERTLSCFRREHEGLYRRLRQGVSPRSG